MEHRIDCVLLNGMADIANNYVLYNGKEYNVYSKKNAEGLYETIIYDDLLSKCIYKYDLESLHVIYEHIQNNMFVDIVCVDDMYYDKSINYEYFCNLIKKAKEKKRHALSIDVFHKIKKGEINLFYDYSVSVVINGIETTSYKDSWVSSLGFWTAYHGYIVVSDSNVINSIPIEDVITEKVFRERECVTRVLIPQKYVDKIILRRRYLQTEYIESDLKKNYTGKMDVYELNLRNPDIEMMSLFEKYRAILYNKYNLQEFSNKAYFRNFVEKYNIMHLFFDNMLMLRYNRYILLIYVFEKLGKDCRLYMCDVKSHCVASDYEVVYKYGVKTSSVPYDYSILDAFLEQSLFFNPHSIDFVEKYDDSVEPSFCKLIWALDKYIYGNPNFMECEFEKSQHTVNHEFFKIYGYAIDHFLKG